VARKRDTGDGDPYSDAEADQIADAIEAAMADSWNDDGDYTGASGPDIVVTAEIEWAGTVDHTGSGVRTTRLDGLNLRDVIVAVQRLREAEGRNRPLRSYNAKSWEAQLRQINNVKRGPDALRAAGFSPSRRTLRRWEQGTQKPSKANREKIAAAYDDLRNPGRRAEARARHAVADALTEATRQRYGVNVRFRDIRQFRFD
jgi:hypothetical protein